MRNINTHYLFGLSFLMASVRAKVASGGDYRIALINWNSSFDKKMASPLFRSSRPIGRPNNDVKQAVKLSAPSPITKNDIPNKPDNDY
jgi:hypothetical protein